MPYRLVASINPNLISMSYNIDFPFQRNFENFGWYGLLYKQTML